MTGPSQLSRGDHGGSTPLVLVVDSESIIVSGLTAMLEGWGYRVLAATTGRDALQALASRGEVPCFVLADYQLDDGSTGPELLAGVRAATGRPVPGVVLTGDTGAERLREAHAGGYSIVHKPLHPSDLARLLARHSPLDEKADGVLQS